MLRVGFFSSFFFVFVIVHASLPPRIPARLIASSSSFFQWEFIFVRHYVRMWFTSCMIVGFFLFSPSFFFFLFFSFEGRASVPEEKEEEEEEEKRGDLKVRIMTRTLD